ncbi:MAG TPA: hypothetical protein DDZ80_19120 [Cyanobacteria bacterium UBA8803]|nr:hypothetical protein [Cyanobacteria bacterium UBA9273]HBL60485.1 hypothetical protein [Cyanobacteria bacterium UBA8803]
MPETQEEKTNEPAPVVNEVKPKFGSFLQNWKIRTGLIATAVVSMVVGLFLVVFFWPHMVAGMGMNTWSKRAGAHPIECMIRDTNNDGYVSCSAMLEGEVVPLECGASLFNIGCRVNYGAAAAPPLRPSTLPKGSGRF